MEFSNKVLFQESVVHMGINIYNRVSGSIKNLDNFKLLKKKELKSFLLSHYF